MGVDIAEEERIVLRSQFVSGEDYTTIENAVETALKSGKPIKIDLTRAIKGVQTEFYGALWNSVTKTLPEEQQVPKAQELITIVFESPASPAYDRFRCLFYGIFGNQFQNL